MQVYMIKSKDIKFIYSYFNKFLLIIKNNTLFIIINNKKKYISRWIIQNNNLISDNNYNCNLDKKHLDMLFNGYSDINYIKICSNEYKYYNNSIFGKTLEILTDMKIFK